MISSSIYTNEILHDTWQVYLLTVLKGLKHRLAAGISLLFLLFLGHFNV